MHPQRSLRHLRDKLSISEPQIAYFHFLVNMVDGYTVTSLSTMISGTTEITNTCTAVFNLTEVSKESDDGMTRLWEIQFMVFRVTYIIIIIGGTFGNILTFIVMQKGSLKEVSTCFYMSILALVDTGKQKLCS